MAIDNNFYKNRKIKDFYFSLGFLVITILITIFLYFYNLNIENNNKELQAKLIEVNTDIKKLEENKSIIVYNIYSKNKVVFDKKEKQSQIPQFIRHLKKVYKGYNMKFSGFSYSNGKVSTKVLVETDEKRILYDNGKIKFNDIKSAYMKVINLLDVYNKVDSNLFTLDKVTKFSGYNNMKFSAVFKLK